MREDFWAKWAGDLRMKAKTTILIAGLMALSFGQSSGAQIASVQALLAERNPAAKLDTFGFEDRSSLVKGLVAALPGADADRKLSIANTLCQASAWNVAEEGTHIQDQIWAEMAAVTDPQSALAYALDCAAANREGYYRASTLSPLFDLRLAYCAGQPFGKDPWEELDKARRQMESFSREVETGLAEASDKVGLPSSVKSFFPLRTAFRIATIRAARAVLLAEDDWSAAQAEFAQTAEGLRAAAPKDYRAPWGAWRYHNDFEFYANFYGWLGGVEDLNMAKLKDWPELTKDTVVKEGLPVGLLEQIGTDIGAQRNAGHSAEPYVDWIYLERLLPGASRGDAECSNWRRRFYNTHELAAQVAFCAVEAPTSAAELSALDTCIHQYEAKDWSVQYMTIRADDEGAANTVIQRFATDLAEQARQIEGLSIEDTAKLEGVLTSFKPYSVDGRDGVFRMVTDEGLTTDMRNTLEAVIDSGNVMLPWGTAPLFRRPTHY